MEFEISLNDLKFYAYHGVFDEERRIGNEFIVGLSVFIPFDKRIENDELEGTVSYAELYEIVKEEMSKPHNLLEKVAHNIWVRIKEKYEQISRGFIRIEKSRPPVAGMLGTASVTLRF